MPKKPNIIATGLSGLVGSRLVELLGSRFDFTNLDLTTGVDITDLKLLKGPFREAKGKIVLHLAAFTDVDAAHLQKGDKNGSCYRINVLGTRNIAALASKFDKYLIHISTDFVFDGKKGAEYKEEDDPNPIEWYGQTKLWAEEEVLKSGASHAILRIAFPFRAHFPEKTDLVRTIMEKLKQKTLYPMFADQTITPTFIDDIAQALEVVFERKPRDLYHIVGSSHLSPYELSQKIAVLLGIDSQVVKAGSLKEYLKTAKRPYQVNLALSNQKAERDLGVKMSTVDQALNQIRKQLPDL